ncbi:MAG: DUF6089 family protein, partial [Bacteroidota bacterium]
MKNSIFHIIVLLLSFTPSLWTQSQRWELGLMGGGSFYSGDLTTGGLSLLDEFNPAAGLLIRYNAHPVLSARTTITFGRLSGNDLNASNNDFRMSRAFEFNTQFQEYGLGLEWHILGKKRKAKIASKGVSLWPYVFAGGALYRYTPEPNFSNTLLAEDIGKLIIDDLEQAKPNTSFTIPFGIGAQIDVNPQFHIGVELGIRPARTDYLDGISLTAEPDNDDWYSTLMVQFTYRFGKLDRDKDGVADKEDDCPSVPGIKSLNGCPDADEDGLTDAIDNCPDVAGPSSMGGCPDTDGDGIADRDDQCPEQFGPLSHQGCPIIDRDGDGVIDEEDQCPDVPGNLAAGGCPVADTDQDGILDNFDKCPGVFGLAIFEGCPDTDGDGIEDAKDKCPEIFGDFDAQGCPLTEAPKDLLTRIQSLSIFFGKDSYSIALEYYQDLQEVASFLEKYPDYFLTVNGFADSAEGKDRGRRWLAQKRAQSIAQ